MGIQPSVAYITAARLFLWRKPTRGRIQHGDCYCSTRSKAFPSPPREMVLSGTPGICRLPSKRSVVFSAGLQILSFIRAGYHHDLRKYRIAAFVLFMLM